MARERVLITVKTYPTLSRKHGELVCTAGVREDGSWVRLYPVPFRLLDYKDRYQKFDWIETRLVRNTKDPRPETFHLADVSDIEQTGHLDTTDNWRERRNLLLKKAKVYDQLEPLIAAAHANQLSLAVFRPTKVLDFVWEQDERDWDQSKVDQMRNNADQGELFAGDSWRQTFKLMPKLPFKFSYRFEDAIGKSSELQILDWEAGQLFWNCRRDAQGDERLALQKVREKYIDQFLKTDLHFFLGTTKEFHSWAHNPFVIIGVFPIPHEKQFSLL
jgi:hypothetical protein